MIGVYIQDENGRTESKFDDPLIVRALLPAAAAETKCLQFIDPYGDTTFNRYQAKVLAEEIADASAALRDDSVRTRAQALGQFVSRVADSIHMYVKFVGD